MSLTERLAPISTLARQCLISFERCLRGTSTLDSQRCSTIEDQMARFSIWTSNMAVFASGKACMDHRVREAPEVQRLILGILEILQGRIDECIRLVDRLIDPQCSIEIRYSVLAQGDFEKTADGISSEVGLLHELSNTIRKASRESQDIKVATSFRIKDEEGNYIEDILKEYFVKNLRDRFPESSDAICDRLAATMILRRKRILYRRSRYSVNPIKPTQPVLKPTVQTRIVPRQLETQALQLPSQAIKPAAAPSRVYSAVQSATTLAPQNFQRASAPSAVSQVKSVDLGSHEDLIFPPRPEDPGHGMIEVTCPYCLYVLSGLEVSNEARWRKHVLGDLDALVCLFDPCDEPEVLYRHSRDWLQHMRKHAQRWRCSAKSHGVQRFGSREEFENHMKESHKKHYTSAQLDLLAERGMRSLGPLFEACPLCGGKEDTEDNAISGSLIDHIVGHLRSLALKSLPPYYRENDDGSSNSHDDESVKSRSTIRKVLEEDNSLLHFSEVQLDYSTWDTDSIDWRFVHEVLPPPEEDDQDPIIKKFVAYKTESLAQDFASFNPEPASQDFVLFDSKPVSNPLFGVVAPSPATLTGIQEYESQYNDEGDDYDYEDIEKYFENSRMQNIVPTYEGFRQHILKLNPRLQTTNTYLVDRIATHCMARLNRLKDLKRNHLELVNQRNCPSGTLCFALGGRTARRRPEARGEPQPSDSGSDYDGRIKPDDFPPGIPMPPTASLPAELECQLCFTSKKFQKPSDWTKHVHQDVQPFSCTWDGCRDPKMYKRKADWVRHENDAHRHLEWWTCDIVNCQFTCYRRDNFLQHLVREHGFPEPKVKLRGNFRGNMKAFSDITWERVEKCRFETQSEPSDEACRFCGKSFPTWKKLTIHLAKHMEQISLPIAQVLEASENEAAGLEGDPTPQNFGSLQISAEQGRRAYSKALAAALRVEPATIPTRERLPGLDDMGLRHVGEALPSLDHIGLRDHMKLPNIDQTIMQRDRPMIDHFVQFVLPNIFPIHQLTRQGQSMSLFVLTSLETNESYLHCCLMLAAQHYKFVMNSRAESIDISILKHNTMLIKTLQNLLTRKEDYEQVLQTTLSLITFQCHIGVYDSPVVRIPFHEHIKGATSIAHVLELPGLVSSSKQPEGFDRIYISMTAWVDILGATMKGSAPYFARIYRERHLSTNDSHLGLVNLMGCEDRVMYLISEIACLDMLVTQGIDEADLRRHTTILEAQLDDVKRHEGTPEIFITVNGSLNLRQLTYYITEAFIAAAKLYLRCLDPNFFPHKLDCMGQVERITDLVQYVPSGPKGYDQCLVWVYLVCGSVSLPSSPFRHFFNDRVVQLGDSAKLGSFGGLVSVLQEIWHPTHSEIQDPLVEPRHPAWRGAMERKGWDYLLI